MLEQKASIKITTMKAALAAFGFLHLMRFSPQM